MALRIQPGKTPSKMLQKVNADNDIHEQQPDIAREFVLPFVHIYGAFS